MDRNDSQVSSDDPVLWDFKALRRWTSLDRKTVERDVKRGTFPPPALIICNGAKQQRYRKLWHKDTVLGWLKQRAERALEAVE